MALVGFQVEGFPSRLHHVYRGGGVIFNDFDFDGEEQKICCNFVDELRGQGKSETLKKVGDITVYRTD